MSLLNLTKENPQAASAAMKEVLKDYYRSSLYLVAKDLLGYKDVNIETHGHIIRALESATKRKLIVVPRGCLKSSLGVVAFSIWLLLRNPNERILIDSEVYTNSKNFLREIRAHLENPRITSIFGEFKSSTWNEGEIVIAQRTIPYKEASITCGGIGTVKVGQHYSVILEDDINSRNNSESSEGKLKVLNHYRMNTAILEPDGIISITATRYAKDDVVGFLLDNEIDPPKK